MIGKVILIISPEPWGANFVSKHHYANYLSKENTVYFLNPASGFTKNPFGNVRATITPIKPNLHTIDYVNLLPRLDRFPKKVQEKTFRKQAKQILTVIPEHVNLIWSFDPHRYFDQTIWNAPQTLYHTVDFHPNALYEETIIQTSDHYLGVAELILAEHHQIRKGTLIPHAADLDSFHKKNTVSLPGTRKHKACYVGNFHRHIDYGILEKLAKEQPDVDFILIGPTADSNLSAGNKIHTDQLNALEQQANLHFIGSVPSDELMNYISQADINLVLFKKEHERIHCSPHKLMGYFYSGKITLSNYIDAHKNTDPEIIQMESDQAKIPAAFDRIIRDLENHNNQTKQAKRRAYAEENGYMDRIREIAKLLASNTTD